MRPADQAIIDASTVLARASDDELSNAYELIDRLLKLGAGEARLSVVAALMRQTHIARRVQPKEVADG